MRLRYQGALFDFDMSDELQRIYAKRAIKEQLALAMGRRYRGDRFLSVAYEHLAGVAAPIMIDVGCNIGTTILPLAAKFADGTFLAVDAHPVAGAGLIKNARLNRLANLTVISAAISDQPGVTRIYTEPINTGGSRLTGFAGRPDIAAIETHDDIVIPAIRLSWLLEYSQVTHADLLKIDVEGLELGVLRSMGDALTPDAFPLIVSEYGPEGSRAAGVTGWDMVSYMLERGYQCSELESGRSVSAECDIPALAECTTTDFIFAPAAQ